MPQKNSKLNVTVSDSTERAIKKRPGFEQAFKNTAKPAEPMKKVTATVPLSAQVRLKVHATRTGKTINELILEYINQLED